MNGQLFPDMPLSAADQRLLEREQREAAERAEVRRLAEERRLCDQGRGIHAPLEAYEEAVRKERAAPGLAALRARAAGRAQTSLPFLDEPLYRSP